MVDPPSIGDLAIMSGHAQVGTAVKGMCLRRRPTGGLHSWREEGEVGLLSCGGMYGLVYGDLTGLKQLGPAKRVALTEGREARLEGPMHSLRDAVTLGVVRGGIVESDVMLVAELLKVSPGELASVVHYDASRGPVVCQVLP